MWQWLGISGDAIGTSGTLIRTFLYALGFGAAIAAVFNTINVITVVHEEPGYGLAGPIVWEASSWLSLVAFFWLPWIAYRLAPPFVRPRWLLLIHIPGALLYSLAHVSTFVLLRRFAYWLDGYTYDFGTFWPHFAYEFRKDVLGYALFIAGFTVIEHLLR